jgi:glycosyltransferase involved in cell wall biosynthesis
MQKIRILRITQSLDIKLGGIANYILGSSIALSRRGFQVDILTYDNQKSFYFNKRKIKIINKGPAYGKFTFSFNLLFWLIKNKEKYDLFIIEGIWQFSTLIARLILKDKYYVYLHGSLDPYFSTEFFKCLKKKIYWLLVEKQNLLNSNSILLTNTLEKNQLNNTYVNTNNIKKKVVGGIGIAKPRFVKKRVLNKFYKKFPLLKKKRFLLFLGRFHQKKGCDTLVKAMKKLSKKNIKINILMAGPNSKYKNDIKKMSEIYGLNHSIFWSDTLGGNLKWGAIVASQGMVLPTNGENFGIALAESLSCSRPVLTTYKTNIYKEIQDSGAGLISQNKVNDFAKILIKFNNLNNKEILKYSKNSLKCFNDNFNIRYNINTLAKFLKSEI